MRSIPSILSSRLKSNIQTRASKSDPSASLWVGRPNTVLVDDAFLERQTVKTASIEDVSIAVCHPKIKKANTKIYMAYISNGTAKVVSANSKYAMAQHSWSDEGFSQTATAVSIAFDGTMPMTDRGDVEFVTEEIPWVFWVNDGMLFAQKLGGETITLAESNCVDISAIRAAWSQASTFDFGLVAFFILGSSLYYRQLINGEWTDAELVSFGPSGVYWAEVSAFRTWDYRVGVQLKSTDGDIYELFTQFMGIATRHTEHLELKSASHRSSMTSIRYTDAKTAEHITISDAANITPYQGIYSLGTPSLTNVYNIANNDGDWGKTVVFVFDKELNNDTVQDSIDSFYFVDEADNYYYPISIEMDNTGRQAILSYVDFNNSSGKCMAHYDMGSVTTMLGEVLSAQSFEFTPTNLIPNDNVLPEVAEIWIINDNGTQVAIRFTEPLIAAPIETAEKFVVTISEPEYVPGGSLSRSIKPVIFVELDNEDSSVLVLHFQDGMFTSIRNSVGEVTIQYIGTTLKGSDGPVLGFVKRFVPEGLYMKPNPNDAEHIEIIDANWNSALIDIEYLQATAPGEHLGVIAADMNGGVLTHINDL